MTDASALIPVRPRCREALLALGAAHLDEAALLAILIGTGSAGRNAEAIARGLLAEAGGLSGVAALEPSQLARRRGLGTVRAVRVAAAFELGRRLSAAPDARRLPIRSPEDALRCVPDLVEATREHLVGLYLDGQGRLIARETLAIGSLNVARATPRDVLEPALRRLAAAFLLLHNHPSGSPEPSEDDRRFTRTIGRAGALFGVPLYDHVIVAREGFVSLRARGVVWEGS